MAMPTVPYWEPEIARQPEALDQYQQRLSAEIFYYIQFEFFRQWSAKGAARHPNYWRHPDSRSR